MMRSPKTNQEKYDTTNTSRTGRKHSRRACRNGRRNRNRLDRLGNDQRGRSQSRRVYASARARNSRHRVDRGDRVLRIVSRSLIFNGEALDVAPETQFMNLIIAVASSGGVTNILQQTAETFGWNWKLFLSQVISFCIVAFLLQRFAYKPILAVLEQRRRTIEEGQINAEKIKKELAEAEKRYQEIITKANTDGQRMIDEARESSAHLADRKQQEAIAAAEQIITKAREAAALEHERTMESLKRELGRLVVETTAKVTDKVLTPEDQRRLQEETARQLT